MADSAHRDPTRTPPTSNLRQIRLLIANVRRAIAISFRQERGLTARYVIISIVNALLPVFIAYVGKQIVDHVVLAMNAEPSERALAPTLGWVGVELALILLQHIAGQWIGYLGQLLRTRLALHITQMIFEKALGLSMRYFEDSTFMDMLERARKEAGWRPLEMITHGLSLGRNVITLIGYAVLLTQFSGWAVLALAVAGLPFLAETRFAAEQYRLRMARTMDERKAYYLQQLLSSDYHAKEVKLFDLGPMLLDRHIRYHESFFDVDRKFARRRALAVTALGMISVGVFYGIYAWVVGLTAFGVITLGSMTLYLTVFRQGQGAFQSAMTSLARAYEDNLYMNNLFEYLAIREDDASSRRLEELATGEQSAPAVEFRNLSFAYPGSDRDALFDINLTIKPGETIALVGPNGAGKTTLVKLLCGLYELESGEIAIDGTSIRAMDRSELRSRIGVLFQDFIHYHFTASDNVGLGWLPSMKDRETVVRAAKEAGADEIIESLPQSYDTMLGRWFGGEQLSIGQWQRIALARAFMRESGILILDEPTAAIDAEGEHEIFERFRRLKERATVILITHRFSTVRMADRIVVLDAGRIVEEGAHADLLARDGLYARMFKLQAEGYRV